MLPASGRAVFTSVLRHSCRRNVYVSSVGSWRTYSTPTVPLPMADEEPKVYSSKIENLVSEISLLTLLEVADLNTLLKKTLNISEAPVMQMGAGPAAAQEDDEPLEAVKVQTAFTLKLTGYDQTKKVPLIKYMKSIMEGMNLVQAKKFVENLPANVRTDVGKDEVEKLKEELGAVGAESMIE